VGEQAPGQHDFTTQLADLQLPSGVYLVTLQVDNMSFAVKTTFLR
jgi:hypothetical protein